MNFEEAITEVWRQALVDGSKFVRLGDERFPVRTTGKTGLRMVDFVFQGRELRGLEQNPATKSRWAALARDGAKVMQLLDEQGRYVAVVVDGKLRTYKRGLQR